ncbi:MAG: nitroreductase family protein [Tannerella sp.]|jgi:nitroreductase|nr:nitroreductase family protein [Tannerella sp.]
MLLESMKNRRSIRQYTSEDIPETLLNELFEVAARTSNTGNMQLYSVVVTRDRESKERQAPFHFNQKMVTEAPVLLTFCADANRFVKWATQRNASPGFDNLQTFIAATIDAMLFAQAFCDAAEANGLGICYLGTTAYNADKIIEALELPYLVVPIVSLTVGYPAEPLPEQPDRLPPEAIIHHEKYQDFTPESIDRIYKPREELEVNRKYVLENGKDTLAQVFTDVRYTKANNEYFSEVFLTVLQKQGFLSISNTSFGNFIHNA